MSSTDLARLRRLCDRELHGEYAGLMRWLELLQRRRGQWDENPFLEGFIVKRLRLIERVSRERGPRKRDHCT